MSGFVLLIPPLWFKHYHFAHHRFTQSLKKDPELETPKPSTVQQWVLHISGYTTWKGLLKNLAVSAIKPIQFEYVAVKDRNVVRQEIVVMVCAYIGLFGVSLLLASSVLFWVWIVPVLLGQPFLRLYLLAEHADCALSENMFRNTRTVLSNPVVRWFTWNMPYHTEHHVYPGVPFHQLPNLHAHVMAYCEELENSYTSFNIRYAKTILKQKIK